ncbi:MAG: response regulator [Burkholderiales bacterium]|nr:response regulator [Bacteroidia bacterium]
MKNYPHFKIVILEDNDFYNKLMSRYIKTHIARCALLKRFTFELASFTTYSDCARNFQNDVNIILTDYFLNDGYSALSILELVKKRGVDCKVIVLSQIQNITTSICTLLEGAYEFIPKNRSALEKSGHMIEDIIGQSLHKKSGRLHLN